MKFNAKTLAYILIDIIIFLFSFLLAAYIRFDFVFSNAIGWMRGAGWEYYATFFIVMFGLNLILGTYRTIFMRVTFRDVSRQGIVAVLTVILAYLAHRVFDFPFATSITVLFSSLCCGFSLLVRCAEQLFGTLAISRRAKDGNACRAIIVGAGTAGGMLINMLLSRRDMGHIPVAVVDDNPAKHHMLVSGVRVEGAIAAVAAAAKKHRADEIIIAIPSASGAALKEIAKKCQEASLPIKTFGDVSDLREFIHGEKSSLRDLSIEDLLFRDSVKPDMSSVREYIAGKTVLVTGGAGSIGSEICRQVLELGCRYLVIMDFNENGLFFLRNDLLEKYPESRFCVRVGSIRDKERMNYLFRRHKFDIVFHAAAHKHVPLMEDNAFEAVKNNIFGTKNTIECCIENNVKKFILISTDKAVNPTNIMGATKRVAELLVSRFNGMGGCEMAAVRFGNVLGSNGSVIPIFRRQIEAGGPVTVTHRDIMRYFMTIPEAVSLVLSAGTAAKGGEVFVLDMGEPVSIYDLACNMIKLAGLKVDEDIKIEFTGLRPGEKMFEELKLEDESFTRTAHDKIFIMHANEATEKVDRDLDALSDLVARDSGEPALRSAVFDTISIDYNESTRHGATLNEFCSIS